MSSAAEQIIDQLPDPFTRQDVLAVAKEMGYSYDTGNSMPQRLTYKGLAERTGRGTYEKTLEAYYPQDTPDTSWINDNDNHQQQRDLKN